jgi:hypothetical protein
MFFTRDAIMENSQSDGNSPEMTWKLNQVVYADILNELHEHFLKLNVRYMQNKGAYLICSGLAEKMKYRRMDDIDIWVGKEDFEKTSDYFSSLPRVEVFLDDWDFEREFTYTTGSFECHLEIHSLLNYPARFSLPFEKLFERALPAGETRMLPCPEDALVILLCHALVHIGFELRDTIFDEISLISNQKGFSWDKFWGLAKPTGIEQFMCMILFLYAKKTGRCIVLPQSSFRAIMGRTLLSGRFYKWMPVAMRKLLFEIPFVRNPEWLLKQKLIRGKFRPLNPK